MNARGPDTPSNLHIDRSVRMVDLGVVSGTDSLPQARPGECRAARALGDSATALCRQSRPGGTGGVAVAVVG